MVHAGNRAEQPQQRRLAVDHDPRKAPLLQQRQVTQRHQAVAQALVAPDEERSAGRLAAPSARRVELGHQVAQPEMHRQRHRRFEALLEQGEPGRVVSAQQPGEAVVQARRGHVGFEFQRAAEAAFCVFGPAQGLEGIAQVVVRLR